MTGKAENRQEGKRPFIIIAILIVIGLLFISKTDIFKLEPGIDATGSILSPSNKAKLDKTFVVAGETKGVNADQYVWLAFDNPEFRTCFPRAQVPGNEKFKATVIENRLKDHLRLSLYVLNEAEHEKWVDWRNAPDPQGVKMPSGQKHLDHANIVLK
jgi:preprotein translocase subunit SecF